MSPTPNRVLAPVLVALALTAGSLLAGCGVSTDDKPSSQASESATPEATGSATPSPSETPTPSQTPTPTAAASPTLAPAAALLTAQQMPPLTDTQPWRQVRTGPVGSNQFGLCAKFDVLSIGAEQAVERTFVSGARSDLARAAQQIATFPDAATTARAQKVLQSWHDTCASRLRTSRVGTHVKVTPITLVPVPQGTGWWYLVSYVPRVVLTSGNGGHFHSFGVAVVGNRISLIAMDHPGQDHNYPPGQDPMQLAVKAAAGKLG